MYLPIYYRIFRSDLITVNDNWQLEIYTLSKVSYSKCSDEKFDDLYRFAFYFLSENADLMSSDDSLFISNIIIQNEQKEEIKKYQGNYKTKKLPGLTSGELGFQEYPLIKIGDINDKVMIPKDVDTIYFSFTVEIKDRNGNYFKKDFYVPYKRSDYKNWEFRIITGY